MKIDYEKYKNIEIDKDKFKDIPTNVEHLRNCLAICYILMEDKDKEIERLNTDKEQLNSLVNSCQEEIRRLNKRIEIKNNRIQQLMNRTRSARIDKAIEYIKRYDGKPVLRDYYDRDLLNILQGSDKE